MAAAGGGLWYLPHPENASYRYGNQGHILVFRLDGGATPRPPPLPPIEPMPKPPPQTASAAVIARGQALFAANCATCHVNLPRSGSADLTRLTPETHAAFDQIVFGGLLKEQGMPQWSDVLTKDDVHALHAYVIQMSQDAWRARQAGKAQQTKAPNAKAPNGPS